MSTMKIGNIHLSCNETLPEPLNIKRDIATKPSHKIVKTLSNKLRPMRMCINVDPMRSSYRPDDCVINPSLVLGWRLFTANPAIETRPCSGPSRLRETQELV